MKYNSVKRIFQLDNANFFCYFLFSRKRKNAKAFFSGARGADPCAVQLRQD